jgi:glucan 1,3-beta-glucosidase
MASHQAVSSIELLNEPLGGKGNVDVNTVKQFYYDGWGDLKNSGVAVAFHDAFQGVTAWNDWGAGMGNLLLDTHHYQIFVNDQVSQGIDSHIKTACAFGNQMASTGKPTIAGEWTGGITDCAKWLNGKNKGARYDGTFEGSSKIGECAGKSTGSVDALSSDDKNNIGRFIEAQLDAFEKAAGWIFWTWKTEGAPEWDMQDLLAGGIFPQPLDSRKRKSCSRQLRGIMLTIMYRPRPVQLSIRTCFEFQLFQPFRPHLTLAAPRH